MLLDIIEGLQNWTLDTLKTSRKAQTALATAAVLGALYSYAGLNSEDAIKARQAVEPVYELFDQAVQNLTPKYVTSEGDDNRVIALDYGGAIDHILEKRDEILDQYGVKAFSSNPQNHRTWNVKLKSWGNQIAEDNMLIFDPTPWE